MTASDINPIASPVPSAFSFKRSARGEMAPRKLIVFKHESELGNAPAQKLFDLVTVSRKDDAKPARAFTDYEVKVDKGGVPQGVELIEMV